MVSLKELQELPLRVKIDYAKGKIEEFVEHVGGWEKVYISFSGGKDSTVLCELARELNPEVKIMFVNTGRELPEIVSFVKKKQKEGWNIDITQPKIRFEEVVKKYGYPVISKEQSFRIYKLKNYNLSKDYRKKQMKKLGKWKKALDYNFKISSTCCDVMKKRPAKKYEKDNKRNPIVGTMADESLQRRQRWEKEGCNSFKTKRIISKPLSVWTEKDIWEYIKINNVEISEAYTVHGYKRTGCWGCLYGCHLEKGVNRIQRLEKTHPKLHNHLINNLGYDKICKEIGIEYTANDIKWYLEENITCKEQKNLF